MIVMVVEDSMTMRRLICHALEKIEQITIVEARDGGEALAKLGELTPDVLVTDINMPKVDGFTLIREVRARVETQHIPVVVLTTASALADLERAKALGVAGYVTKPVKADAIVDAVRGAVVSRA